LAQLGHPQPHFAADAFDHCVTAYNGPNAAVVVVYGFFKGAFPMKACKRGAFTLIELLVVIAIIAILAAILFPVFAKARARANSTACLSNMKQIGIALYTYLNDYDECYPVLRRVNVPVPYTWRESLAPYAKSKDVFACPANPDAKKYPKTTAEGGTLPISYALNGSLFSERGYQCVPCGEDVSDQGAVEFSLRHGIAAPFGGTGGLAGWPVHVPGAETGVLLPP
jgi:prepilin-type N-terminal cleavage/methylation domain-containing protein